MNHFIVVAALLVVSVPSVQAFAFEKNNGSGYMLAQMTPDFNSGDDMNSILDLTPNSFDNFRQQDDYDGPGMHYLGERNPFQVPPYIKEILDDFLLNQRGESFDRNIESIRRWPLRDYKVVAIMWDVAEPKVMISDKNGNTHMVRVNTRIGNKGGFVTEIKEGEVVVKERDILIVLKLTKGSSEGVP